MTRLNFLLIFPNFGDVLTCTSGTGLSYINVFIRGRLFDQLELPKEVTSGVLVCKKSRLHVATRSASRTVLFIEGILRVARISNHVVISVDLDTKGNCGANCEPNKSDIFESKI